MRTNEQRVTADDLEIAVVQGLNPNQLARDRGVSRGTVLRAEQRVGITLKRFKPEDMMKGRDYRDAVQDMKTTDAVEYLLDVIAELIDAPDQPWNLPGISMTFGERNVFYTLAQASGRIVSKEALMRGYMVGRGGDEEPEMKILDVYVCKLRRKIKDTGIEICTEWGLGYRLTAPEGYVWPWDGAA